MLNNIIAKIEKLLNKFREGIVEILKGEKNRGLSRILCLGKVA